MRRLYQQTISVSAYLLAAGIGSRFGIKGARTQRTVASARKVNLGIGLSRPEAATFLAQQKCESALKRPRRPNFQLSLGHWPLSAMCGLLRQRRSADQLTSTPMLPSPVAGS